MSNESITPVPEAVSDAPTPIDYLLTTPPAQGSLVQAWISIARNPSRQNIAAWVRCGEDRAWARSSLVVAAVLLIVTSIASSVFRWNVLDRHQSVVLTQEILNVVILPLNVIVGFIATIVGLALAMPQSFGSLGERCRRVVPTMFIIQPIIYGLFIISQALNFGTIVSFHNGFSCLLLFAMGGIASYVFIIFIQSSAVASAQSRIRVLVVLVLVYFAQTIFILPIRLLLNAIFHVHLGIV